MPVHERRPRFGRGGQERPVDRRRVVAARRIVVPERDQKLSVRIDRVKACRDVRHRRSSFAARKVVRQEVAGDDDDGRIGIAPT